MVHKRTAFAILVSAMTTVHAGFFRGGNGRLLSSWRKSLRPVRDAKTLQLGISQFYDHTSDMWVDTWGEHMHHGFYPVPTGRERRRSIEDHILAQELMINNALKWSYLGTVDEDIERLKSPAYLGKDGFRLVDVGCGVGGSSRFICREYGAAGKGISLSNRQIELANNMTQAVGLSASLQYEKGDALSMPFGDHSCDLAWSMESGEHMPDKVKFVQELKRVVSPGGRVIIVTWCQRENDNEALSDREQGLLHKICDAYYLPEWVSASEYVTIATQLGFEDVRCDDWTDHVKPFWGGVIRSCLQPRNLWRVLSGGRMTIKAALASLWMKKGITSGVVRFVIVTAKVPSIPLPEEEEQISEDLTGV